MGLQRTRRPTKLSTTAIHLLGEGIDTQTTRWKLKEPAPIHIRLWLVQVYHRVRVIPQQACGVCRKDGGGRT